MTKIHIFTTEDGDLFSAFVYGHVDPSSLALADIKSALDDKGLDEYYTEGMNVYQFWMRENIDEHGEEYPWEQCSGEEDGAVAVTGVTFQ